MYVIHVRIFYFSKNMTRSTFNKLRILFALRIFHGNYIHVPRTKRNSRTDSLAFSSSVARFVCNELEPSTDKWKHCIFVFDHKGKLARRMCSRGHGESQLRSPEGITFHPERKVLYVADTGNDRIQILEKDGSYLDSIGPIGKRAKNTVKSRRSESLPSHLNQPTDVAVTTTRVVVADSGSHKIKVSTFTVRPTFF